MMLNGTVDIATCAAVVKEVGIQNTTGFVVLAAMGVVFFFVSLWVYVDNAKMHRFLVKKKLLQAYNDWLDERRLS